MISKRVVQPVVLCGGSGTRLWPLSRSGFPKQFLSLTGTDSLFQQSIKRMSGFDKANSISPPYVVCNEDHRFLAQEQLREINVEDAKIILEPVARNTAPALTQAALAARDAGNDAILVVTPADHAINDENAFRIAIETAVNLADEGKIVVLGIKPSSPETGYGYIKAEFGVGEVADVHSFVEKPNEETAQRYLDEGEYYWNAGVFVLKASVWLESLAFFRSDIMQAVDVSWKGRRIDGPFIRPERSAFIEVPSESIDYAVIEKCPHTRFPIKMVPLEAGWNDMGAWDAVWEMSDKEKNNNAIKGDVLIAGSRNSIVHADHRLVALVGVDNLVVIETADAVLVAEKSRSQQVKEIVSQLSLQAREECALHRKVHRPWGWYDSIDVGSRFKVKRIQVNPKASLSLQKHYHRAEHWVVVQGTAEITRGGETLLLSENQSTYIPLGEVHRLSNPGSIPLEIIEVQSGSYLGEDDIMRFDDEYGRSQKANG